MSSVALNAQVDSDWLPMFLLFIILGKNGPESDFNNIDHICCYRYICSVCLLPHRHSDYYNFLAIVTVIVIVLGMKIKYIYFLKWIKMP